MDTAHISQALEQAFPDAKVEVVDLTGGGDHFQVLIVSAQFEGLGLLDRHKRVYEALRVASNEQIHALTLKTLTPEQWKAVSGRLPVR